MTPTQITLVTVLRAYLDELIDGGIPEPLVEAFTLSAVFNDLQRLAGVTETWPGADRVTFTAD